MAGRFTVPGEYIYDGMLMMASTPPELLDRTKTFPFDNDIMVASYPKTGTTWVQEIMWLLHSDGDFEGASKTPSHKRVPYLDLMDSELNRPYMDLLEERDPPRLVKTHLPVRYFNTAIDNNKIKVIVPIRNPKDTLVSYYHFYQMNGHIGNFPGTWSEFFDLVKDNHILYGDIFRWYADCWSYRNHPSVLIIKYEDMKHDLKREVLKMATFLEKKLPDDVIEKITSHGQFESMRKNKMTNFEVMPTEVLNHKISPFLRKGQIGDWINYFTPEQNQFVDDRCKAILEPLGLEFQWQ